MVCLYSLETCYLVFGPFSLKRLPTIKRKRMKHEIIFNFPYDGSKHAVKSKHLCLFFQSCHYTKLGNQILVLTKKGTCHRAARPRLFSAKSGSAAELSPQQPAWNQTKIRK